MESVENQPVAEQLVRANSPELDKILGKTFPVLDDGFVRVVDYCGNDGSIVQAARVSYGAGTKKVSEDRGLIRYLVRHRHSTPLEMCDIKFHIRCPMDLWRQWIRHRTASVNEYSTRYSLAIDSSQKTSSDKWRLQAKDNKQGSSGYLNDWGTLTPVDGYSSAGSYLSVAEEALQDKAREVYNERLKAGVAREQARKDLPLSTYTEAYWKCNLHNLLHFLGLRMETHAQEEIRHYATTIGNEIVARWCPIAYQAYMDYHFNAVTFSKIEIEILKEIMLNNYKSALESAYQAGWLEFKKNSTTELKKNGERIEFEEKALKNLGISSFPWDINFLGLYWTSNAAK